MAAARTPSHLNGSAPERSGAALLLIDVINELEFDEAEHIAAAVEAMAGRIALLKQRAKAAGIPAVYINDNFGRWRSDFRTQVERCLQPHVRGRRLAQILQPEGDDCFVLKPKHSGFYASALDVLLECIGARTLILTGIAGNICVLYTANDAYMRDYRLVVPRDCVISNTEELNFQALAHMETFLKASVECAHEIDLVSLAGDVAFPERRTEP